MIHVRFDDPANLMLCAAFLQRGFPGDVEQEDDMLALTFRLALEPAVERKAVERLLWAWRLAEGTTTEDGFVVSGQPDRQTG